MEGTIDLTSNIHHWQKLNKKRIGTTEHEIIEIIDMNPLDLINNKRFDIVAKYIYGWYEKNGIDSNWGRIIYDNHIWTFNQYDEDDGSGKKGINSFFETFDATLESFKKKGFDENVSLIPISTNNIPIDGAHRITAALLYNQMVKVARLNIEGPNFNYAFFRERGLLTRWCDAITYEYCKLKKDSIIILLFSSAIKEINKIIKIIDPYGSIFYEKDIKFNKNGILNLIKQFKKLGVHSNFYEPIIDNNQLKILVFEPFENKNAKKIKELTKEIKNCSVSNSEESIVYAQVLLNDNSIHFLNNTSIKNNELLEESVRKYRKKINQLNGENFCLVSDTVLVAHGESANSNKLSFIYNENLNSSKLDEEIQQGTQNEFMLTHNYSIDEIIYNPQNHFYYNGVKFATLDVTKRIQKKRKLKDNHFDKELILYYTKKHTKILRLRTTSLKIKLEKILKNWWLR